MFWSRILITFWGQNDFMKMGNSESYSKKLVSFQNGANLKACQISEISVSEMYDSEKWFNNETYYFYKRVTGSLKQQN